VVNSKSIVVTQCAAFLAAAQTASRLDVLEFSKYAIAAGFVTMPFLAYWVMLKWNFKVGNVSYGRAFNIVGAMFSTILYSYYTFSAPKAGLLLASLYWFYVPAAVCTVAYFALYFLFSPDVEAGKKRWVVPIAMLQYITVLSIFAVLVSIVLKHKEYYLVGGKVRIDGRPVVNQRIDWSVKFLTQAGTTNTRDVSQRTDEAGRYLISVPWTEMPNLKTSALRPVIIVNRKGTDPYDEPLDQWNHIPWNIDLIPSPSTS